MYAAYDDLSIYAIGATPEEAIANARRDANEPDATFKTAPITDEMAAEIEENGWNGNSQAFYVDRSTGILYPHFFDAYINPEA